MVFYHLAKLGEGGGQEVSEPVVSDGEAIYAGCCEGFAGWRSHEVEIAGGVEGGHCF